MFNNLRFSSVRIVLPLAVAVGCTEPTAPQSESESQLATNRLQVPEEGDISLDGSPFVPRSLGALGYETVIVRLSRAPVATAQETAGRVLSASEKRAARAPIAAEQAAIEPQIEALGGQVVGRFRDAYNGLRVVIDRSQLESLNNISGVTKVTKSRTYERTNSNGVPRIAAPSVWSMVPSAFHGEGMKVAIVDTGIDYTHATFGGPGTVESYEEAFATGTAPADPALFGPAAAKIKGGIDLAGDDYNANSDDPAALPQPDLNPLDCNGHGSHVAGTTGGFGVLANGEQYTGPYDDTTHSNNFEVGPGVAPLADLYAVRVFGCAGSTNLVPEALDWAVANDMDVVNMSLGSSFGGTDDASAEAADNAVKAGIVVVASAGNSGPIRFITGSPGSSFGTIAVAAQDPTPQFPGVTLSSGATNITGINANGAEVSPVTLTARVLRDASGAVSLGCDPAEYVAAGVTGQLVIVARGVCARVARAVYGQQAGAAAVLMINNATVLPPFEGQITSNPDTGEDYTVTIPFIGISSTNGAAIIARDGQPVTLGATTITNPGFDRYGTFTSMGPRWSDAHLKPDVTAPGVSIRSAGVGSGNRGAVLSGTSMAAPHVAGLAALTRQAHPSWKPTQVKAAIMNTASAADVVAHLISRGGAGLVDAPGAVQTQAYAYAESVSVSSSHGFREISSDFSVTKSFRVRNDGVSAVTFDVGSSTPQGSPHTVSPSSSSITVPPRTTVSVNVNLTVPAATAGDSTAFREVAGLVTFTPSGGGNSGVALNVPYYAVVRPSSKVKTFVWPRLSTSNPSSTANISNNGGAIAGTADFYAWGLSDANEPEAGYVDIRAVGAQSFPFSGGRQLLVFAVNMHQGWLSPNLIDVELPLDTTGDGVADFIVIGADIGLLTTGTMDGRIASGVLNIATGAINIAFLATAPAGTSTILLPVLNTQIGLSPANPRVLYTAAAFDLRGDAQDDVAEAATFNAYTNAITTGAFETVAPGASTTVPVAIDVAEWAFSPALGNMVVNIDNRSGAFETDLISVAP